VPNTDKASSIDDRMRSLAEQIRTGGPGGGPDFQQLEAIVRVAIEGDPSPDPYLLNLMGLCLMHSGKKARAEQYLRRALDISESRGDDAQAGHALATLGILATRRRRIRAAADLFDRAVDRLSKAGSWESLASTLVLLSNSRNFGQAGLMAQTLWLHVRLGLRSARVFDLALATFARLDPESEDAAVLAATAGWIAQGVSDAEERKECRGVAGMLLHDCAAATGVSDGELRQQLRDRGLVDDEGLASALLSVVRPLVGEGNWRFDPQAVET